MTREVTQTETFVPLTNLSHGQKEFYKERFRDCTVSHVFHLMCFIIFIYIYKCVITL